MRDWEDLFRDEIVKRGFDYYISGDVKSVEKLDAYTYEVIVKGSEYYEVIIEVEDGFIKNMDCTCPYACKGHHCKHMVAALYAIEEGLDFYDDSEAVLENKLKNLSKESLEQLLLTYLKRNETFKKYLLNKFNLLTKKQIIIFKEELRQITRMYYDKEKDNETYFRELKKYLKEHVPNLIGQQNHYAFELCNALYLELANGRFENVEKYAKIMQDELKAYYKQIFSKSSLEQKKQMLKFFDQYLFLPSQIMINQAIIDFYEEVELDEYLLKERFNNIDRMLKKPLIEIFFIQYLETSIRLLVQLNKPLDDILAYIAPFENRKMVIKDKIQLILYFKEYEYAASIIRKMLVVYKHDKEFVLELEELLSSTLDKISCISH